MNSTARKKSRSTPAAASPGAAVETGATQAALEGFLRDLAGCPDVSELLDRLEKLIPTAFGAAAFQVFLLDEITGDLVSCRTFPRQRLSKITAIRESDLPTGAFQREPCDGLHPPSISPLKLAGAAWTLPLVSREKLVGLLMIGGRRDGRMYGEKDLRRMRLLVQDISGAVDRLLLADELELVGRMSRSMAHDLQNLLTPVTTFLQLAGEGMLPPDSRTELLPTAVRNLEAIRAYIKQALVFTRRHQAQFRRCRLDQILRRAADLLETQWKQKQLTVKIRAPAAATAEVDEVLVLRLVGNLLTNAIHAAPPESRITVHLRRAKAGRTGAEQWRIRITDQGQGMTAETLRRILSPAFARRKKGEAEGRLGLGLAICRKIAHLHGGALSLASKEGKGTTAQVQLPTCQSGHGHAEALPPAPIVKQANADMI